MLSAQVNVFFFTYGCSGRDDGGCGGNDIVRGGGEDGCVLVIQTKYRQQSSCGNKCTNQVDVQWIRGGGVDGGRGGDGNRGGGGIRGGGGDRDGGSRGGGGSGNRGGGVRDGSGGGNRGRGSGGGVLHIETKHRQQKSCGKDRMK
jgi:hypothetical protein